MTKKMDRPTTMTAATAMPIPRPALAPVPISLLYRCEMGEALAADGKAVNTAESKRTEIEERDMLGEGLKSR